MPTYSYACTECDDRFDAVQAFTEDALTTCAKCAGRLRKLFNSVGVVFKGSGFYRTDSRDSGKGTSSVPSGGSESSGSGSSSREVRQRRTAPATRAPATRAPSEKSSSSSSSSKSAPATAAS